MADQLQTNYASDLRHILKAVFECNSSEPFLSLDQADSSDDSSTRGDQLASVESGTERNHEDNSSLNEAELEPTTSSEGEILI